MSRLTVNPNFSLWETNLRLTLPDFTGPLLTGRVLVSHIVGVSSPCLGRLDFQQGVLKAAQLDYYPHKEELWFLRETYRGGLFLMYQRDQSEGQGSVLFADLPDEEDPRLARAVRTDSQGLLNSSVYFLTGPESYVRGNLLSKTHFPNGSSQPPPTTEQGFYYDDQGQLDWLEHYLWDLISVSYHRNYRPSNSRSFRVEAGTVCLVSDGLSETYLSTETYYSVAVRPHQQGLRLQPVTTQPNKAGLDRAWLIGPQPNLIRYQPGGIYFQGQLIASLDLARLTVVVKPVDQELLAKLSPAKPAIDSLLYQLLALPDLAPSLSPVYQNSLASLNSHWFEVGRKTDLVKHFGLGLTSLNRDRLARLADLELRFDW